MLEIEDVEGQIWFINPILVSYVTKCTRRRDLTLIGVGGIQIRTKMSVEEFAALYDEEDAEVV